MNCGTPEHEPLADTKDAVAGVARLNPPLVPPTPFRGPAKVDWKTVQQIAAEAAAKAAETSNKGHVGIAMDGDAPFLSVFEAGDELTDPLVPPCLTKGHRYHATAAGDVLYCRRCGKCKPVPLTNGRERSR